MSEPCWAELWKRRTEMCWMLVQLPCPPHPNSGQLFATFWGPTRVIHLCFTVTPQAWAAQEKSRKSTSVSPQECGIEVGIRGDNDPWQRGSISLSAALTQAVFSGLDRGLHSPSGWHHSLTVSTSTHVRRLALVWTLRANVVELQPSPNHELSVCFKGFPGGALSPPGREGREGWVGPGRLEFTQGPVPHTHGGTNRPDWSSHSEPPATLRWLRPRESISPPAGAPILTLERRDEHVPILDELFDEFICPLKLDFMAFDPLPEVGTVQEGVGELQSRETHVSSATQLPCTPWTTGDWASHRGAAMSYTVPQKVFLLL